MSSFQNVLQLWVQRAAAASAAPLPMPRRPIALSKASSIVAVAVVSSEEARKPVVEVPSLEDSASSVPTLESQDSSESFEGAESFEDAETAYEEDMCSDCSEETPTHFTPSVDLDDLYRATELAPFHAARSNDSFYTALSTPASEATATETAFEVCPFRTTDVKALGTMSAAEKTVMWQTKDAEAEPAVAVVVAVTEEKNGEKTAMTRVASLRTAFEKTCEKTSVVSSRAPASVSAEEAATPAPAPVVAEETSAAPAEASSVEEAATAAAPAPVAAEEEKIVLYGLMSPGQSNAPLSWRRTSPKKLPKPASREAAEARGFVFGGGKLAEQLACIAAALMMARGG
eukprot:tig00000144_g9179.t1